MLTSLDKSQFNVFGERGLPENYPTPKQIDGLLFYIQRNLNMNTVVYVLNINNDGHINLDHPMKVYWVKYTSQGEVQELNYIQNKLAFGYSAESINKETFEFFMVSYTKLKFYLVKEENLDHRIVTKINKKDAYLSNIYVYADELGLFPKVKYIELYGLDINSQFPCYQKILI